MDSMELEKQRGITIQVCKNTKNSHVKISLVPHCFPLIVSSYVHHMEGHSHQHN